MQPNYDVKHIVEAINQIESSSDVNSLQDSNLHLWPLLRVSLWMNEVFGPQPFSNTTKAQKLNMARQYIRSYRSYRRLKSQLKKIGRRKILFYAKSIYDTDQIDGTFFHRHIDPLIEQVDGQHSWAKIDFSHSGSDHKPNKRYPIDVLLESQIAYQWQFWRRLWKRIGLRARVAEQNPTLEDVIDTIQKSLGKRHFTPNQIDRMVDSLRSYEWLFREVLQVLKPEVIFMTTYYFLEEMSLILAAHQLNIPVVDVQHGKQGKYHAAYNHWQSLPPGGYDLLPDFFWVWGQESYDNMFLNRPKHVKRHLPIIGGYTWLIKWASQPEFYTPEPHVKAFFEQIKQTSKVILFTTQPLDKLIPDIVTEAIRMGPSDWFWLIRMHPNSLSRREEVTQALQEIGAANVEVDISTAEPLYYLLRQSDHHITGWSTVCYEALAFNIRTTLIHPTAADLYSEYIANNTFSYAKTPQELIEDIQRSSANTSTSEEMPYIDTHPDRPIDAMNMILRHSAPLPAKIKQFPSGGVNNVSSG